MKKIVILGGGTGGTIMANKLRNTLERDEWEITLIDQYKTHYYQPGFLFIPFGSLVLVFACFFVLDFAIFTSPFESFFMTAL